MRKTRVAVLTSVLALSLGINAVVAHAPSVSINTIDGQDATSGAVTLNVALLPTTVNVDGIATHEDPGNINPVKLVLTDNGVEFYNAQPFGGSGNVPSAPFAAPWNITSAGAHQIVATVSHANGDGTDTVDVTVVLNISVNQCPAAPAVAVDYMTNTLGIKSGSKKFKSIINAVAWQTGVNGSLWAANACNPGYADQVKAFVNGLL